MKKTKAVTLTDISRQLNLSIYTVSRAINGLSGVSDSTRQLVCATAEDLGYIANGNARDLRSGARCSVTLLTADTSNSYYLDLISGVESVLQVNDRSLFIADLAINGRYEQINEEILLQQVMENRPGGIISTLVLNEESRSRLRKWDMPVVFVDSIPEGIENSNFSYVATDNTDAAKKIGEHLGFHNYRKWLLLIYPDAWNTRTPRENGLRKAARQAGADIFVLECENNRNSAKHAICTLLDSGEFKPDVVLAANNPLLLGIMSAFNEKNVAVPRDIALVAFDDFAWGDLLTPRITLVAEDSYNIGVKAATYLLDQIYSREEVKKWNGAMTEDLNPVHEIVEASLKIRESCGCSSAIR